MGEPDEDIEPIVNANSGKSVRTLAENGQRSIDPKEWAKERGQRKSLGRRSLHSRQSESPVRSDTSRISRASVDDVYSDQLPVDSVINPDGDAQIDADSDDYDAFDLPRPGTTETVPKAKSKKGKKDKKDKSDSDKKAKKKPPKSRLSARLSKLVTGTQKKGERDGEDDTEASTSGKSKKPSEKEKKKLSLRNSVLRQGKRLSIRKTNPEKQAAKLAKQRAKQEKKEEERRLKEIRQNPWYPAGVDFKFLSPKPVWLPFMGRKESRSELDFGDEARLVGVVA